MGCGWEARLSLGQMTFKSQAKGVGLSSGQLTLPLDCVIRMLAKQLLRPPQDLCAVGQGQGRGFRF